MYLTQDEIDSAARGSLHQACAAALIDCPDGLICVRYVDHWYLVDSDGRVIVDGYIHDDRYVAM